MNSRLELDNLENIESMVDSIEVTHIVSDGDRRILLNLLQEYFRLKANETPSVISAKWDEVEIVLGRLKSKN